MTQLKLDTDAKITWCPGCGNFAILNAIKPVLLELNDEGILPLENVVLVSGIGCHAKIVDYIDINSFYSIHGRTIPVATGIKLANPKLTVICFAGDGDAYAEGLDHLIFAAKRNVNITTIIHNNRVYGLTTGQYTPTSPTNFKGKSTPFGLDVRPINPLDIAFTSGATFIARGYSHGIDLLKDIFKKAVLHQGFSFVDVLQVCVSFFNMYQYYNQNTYRLEEHDPEDHDAAYEKIIEWDYNSNDCATPHIPLGIFYREDSKTFETNFLNSGLSTEDRDLEIKASLKSYL